jgi:hypothetical protein
MRYARASPILKASRDHAAPDHQASNPVPIPAALGNQAMLRRLQRKLTVGAENDPLEREADAVADHVMRMPDPATVSSVSPPRISRKCAVCEEGAAQTVQAKSALTVGTEDGGWPLKNARSSPTIPTADAQELDITDPPPSGGAPAAPAAPAGPSPAGATPVGDVCAQPSSMNRIVSGAFLGGLTVDSYFPDLSGRGFWAHGGTGGPFDTGARAGGNTQLFGVIPSMCIPSQFHFEQTCNIARNRVGGVPTPREGTTFDDLSSSGRDISRPPTRQEFLGGGAAPVGYVISLADIPSVPYSPAHPDVERDCNFVTSLVGPGGRQSVSWSQSVRVKGGVVTVNTLT